MCSGSVTSAAPPVGLPLGITAALTVPRADPNGSGHAGPGAPQSPPADPNRGQRLDVVA